MNVYFVRRSLESQAVTKRTSALHRAVFHGESQYESELNGDWRPPALTNSNREPAHLTRSGRFVPRAFGGRLYELFVDEQIQRRLTSLENIEFVDVVFEKLTDVDMPALGDFSWFEQPYPIDDLPSNQEPTPQYYLRTLPDVPALHDKVGKYVQVLCANLHELTKQYDDIQEIEINYGSWHPGMRRKSGVPADLVSRSALYRYPILGTGAHVLREDAFEILAPHLDLDYFGIAMVTL